MTTDELQEVMSWLKTTDLTEVSFNEGKTGFSLTTKEEPQAPHYPTTPSNRYTPVCSPGLGILQWNKLGLPRKTEEGAAVVEGDTLAIVETSKNASAHVKSPCAGRIARIFVESGSPVEFGQLLFFLEP